MRQLKIYLPLIAAALLLPTLSWAQTGGSVDAMHSVLNNVYNQMIPLCSKITGVCQAVAAFGVMFYIGVRVWKHIARAEPVDFFPLLRPFFLVLLIGIYPDVLSTINAILQPTVSATASLEQNSNDAVNTLLLAEGQMLPGDTSTQVLIGPSVGTNRPGWDKYTQPDNSDSDSGGGFWSTVGSGFKFLASGLIGGLRYMIKFFLSIVLEILYYAAELVISTIRTFHLIVLAVLGPLAFAFSVYDGMQNSLTNWLARYVNIYLWLPIANLFGAILGKIQENMLQIDLSRIQSGSLTLFSATDAAYLIFLCIGCIGYFTVPGIANYIIHTNGPNPIGQKLNQLASSAVSAGAAVATGGASAGATGASAAASGGAGGASGAASMASAAKSASGDPNQYNRDKIAG